ncbi:peptidase M24, structural domain-containing protein [Gilbertella persicaria]|uniref:peptidase M24, structural domain-containing protein n=1 Tax=Gilbertella persicaria TaxID=101096 RepID=UPI0022200CB5|nr:peptidase M24, structural domain-containing protein [Gilbertella persicaria]KAI8051418.1 peptidase M24, structural domain-containing protein [Gilbertella persicaria]
MNPFFPKKINTRLHYFKIKKYLPVTNSGVIYHCGGISHTRDDTDVELDFRQESNFFYLSGVESSAGYHILISTESDAIYLVRPTISPTEQLWKGIPQTDQELLDTYDVDHIIQADQITQLLKDIDPTIIYTLNTTDTSAIPQPFKKQLNIAVLKAAIYEARLTKFPWEISLLRYAAHISSHAHIDLMTTLGNKTKSDVYEAELEAKFRWVCSRNGLPRQCYIPIIASGPRAAVLHYTDNNKRIPIDDPHALVLVDAGGEYRCYGSDVSRTFPASGKFSKEASTIYNIVLKAQNAILDCIKAGVFWKDMHQLVVRTLCQGLRQIGILVGEEEELIRLNIYRAFYFHGTGHSVGLDCHDVGGKGIGILKTGGIKGGISLEHFDRPLEENMVVTVEPGLYFNDVSIQLWTQNREYQSYFNMDKINQYRVVGGVRIEDTIVITRSGHDNLTIAPKQVSDIEAIMQQ